MSKMIDVKDFISLLKIDNSKDNANKKLSKSYTGFATVSTVSQGGIMIIIDGETKPSRKPRPMIDGYIPVANDRVLVIQDVVIGKIKGG